MTVLRDWPSVMAIWPFGTHGCSVILYRLQTFILILGYSVGITAILACLSYPNVSLA